MLQSSLFETMIHPAKIAAPVKKSKHQPPLPEFTIGFKTKVKSSTLVVIKDSRDIAELCRQTIDEDIMDWRETFVVIALTRANRVCGIETKRALGFFRASMGGITGTVADPRLILQFALMANACSLILCHNHPSGNLRPSNADEKLTAKIKAAAENFDIKILDHVIVSSEGYFSFADEGIL